MNFDKYNRTIKAKCLSCASENIQEIPNDLIHCVDCNKAFSKQALISNESGQIIHEFTTDIKSFLRKELGQFSNIRIQ